MRIKEKISQDQRDFTADYECEYCGKGWRGTGYDDEFFHERVIPTMRCTGCGRTSDGAE